LLFRISPIDAIRATFDIAKSLTINAMPLERYLQWVSADAPGACLRNGRQRTM
jgi:hypothetical protein